MSKKLKLTLEALVVETFATEGGRESHGTVRGHETIGADACDGSATAYNCPPSCGGASCQVGDLATQCYDTCYVSCNGCATSVHTPNACNNYSLPACTGSGCTSVLRCTEPDGTCGGAYCDP